MAAGTALAAAVTGAGTELQELMLTRLVAGAAVGAAQSTLLARAGLASLAWTALTAASWSLGWLTTWTYLTDIERGYYVFGAGDALLVTALTGLALRRILASPGASTDAMPPAAAASG